MLPLDPIPGLPHQGQHQHRQRRRQTRLGLFGLQREKRPRIPDLRPRGRPQPALQLEREAAVPLPDRRVRDEQQQGQSGGVVGQDHSARRGRHAQVQLHEHQVLLLGRRKRTQEPPKRDSHFGLEHHPERGQLAQDHGRRHAQLQVPGRVQFGQGLIHPICWSFCYVTKCVIP